MQYTGRRDPRSTSTSPHAASGSRPAPASTSLWQAAARQLSRVGLRRTPPIWREARMVTEMARLHLHPISRGEGLPRGNDRPVFLIPGYMAGDASLATLGRALHAAGWKPRTAGIVLNVGCAAEMYRPIERRLELHVERHGNKALLIGQSRGGAFARVLASRRPDLVDGLITLGSPLLDPLAVHLLVLMNVGIVGALGSLGIPGLLSTACTRRDACCEAVRRDAHAEIPEALPFLSIYSRSDGIVDWRMCLDPAARHVEVDSSHCGMALNIEVWRAIGAELARYAAIRSD